MPSPSLTFSLFIPFKNEIDGLKAILPRIDRGLIQQFVFIDGHSTDGSTEFVKSQGFSVIPQTKPGLLAAWWQGFDACTQDVIIPFSPDNNSVPEDIPKIIHKMTEGYDVCIASRYLGGNHSEDDGAASLFANRFFTTLINILYGAKFSDALTMYKGFHRRLLNDLGLVNRRADHFEVLLACRISKKKEIRCTEIPSREPSRLDDGGSRAHPGALGKYKSAFLFLWIIFRERVSTPN